MVGRGRYRKGEEETRKKSPSRAALANVLYFMGEKEGTRKREEGKSD